MFLATFWQDSKGKQWDPSVFLTCISISLCLQPQVALFNKNLKYYTQPVLLYPQKGSLRFTEEYTEVSHVLLTLRKYSPYFLLSTSFLERNGCKDWWAYWCITAHRTCASIRTCSQCAHPTGLDRCTKTHNHCLWSLSYPLLFNPGIHLYLYVYLHYVAVIMEDLTLLDWLLSFTYLILLLFSQ